MKKNYLIQFLTLILLVFFVGCKKKGCTKRNAINFSEEAKKDDGSCIFPREPHAIVGDFNAVTNCGEEDFTHTMAITEIVQDSKFEIFNVNNWGGNVMIEIIGSVVTIYDNSGLLRFEGGGTFNGTTLLMDYEIFNNSDNLINTCSLEAVKP